MLQRCSVPAFVHDRLCVPLLTWISNVGEEVVA